MKTLIFSLFWLLSIAIISFFQPLDARSANYNTPPKLLCSLTFYIGSARILSTDVDKLTSVATALNGNSDLRLKIIGYIDKHGGTEFSQCLGKRRADATHDYLVNILGADNSRITIECKHIIHADIEKDVKSSRVEIYGY